MKSRGACILTLLLALGGSLARRIEAQSAAKAPISHEAIWLMKRVGAPVPSPDGRWVVFTLVEPAYDDKDQISDLWIVPADGSAKPRRLTATRTGESGAVWSPDSRKIAFSARREGDDASQIYVIDIVGGGEATRVTSLSTGASSPQWRPDGKALLFTSSVFPGTRDDEDNKKIAAERKSQKYRARVYDSFPIRQWDHWLSDTQTHLFVQSLEAGSKARDLLAGTKLVANRGYAGKPTLSGDDLDAVWAPDGESIVFAAATKANAAAYALVPIQLYQIAASGGEPRPLSSRDVCTRPTFSPDGKALYFLLENQTNRVYNLTRIASMSWPVVEPIDSPNQDRVRTASLNLDRSVTTFAISPDGSTLFALAEDAGAERLYFQSAPSSGGGIQEIRPHSGCYTNLAIPRQATSAILFANWESAVNPGEIVRIDPKTGQPSPLTHFNVDRAAGLDWQPLKTFWFTSKAGKRIHNMLVLPQGFDETKKYPLLVLIHGGPHNMWRDQFFLRWNYHLLASPGFVVLLTNYTGSTGFGEKFSQEIQGDPFVGPAAEINQAADEAIRQFSFIDGTRLAAAGASYGGHLANWLEATTTRYKCLIAHAGLINLESQWGTSDEIYHREVNNGGPVWEQGRVWREQNPIRYAKSFKTPMLLTVGENDFRVPLNQTLENWSVLQRQQVPSRLIVFPEENHWIQKGENSRFFYQELHGWLRKWLVPNGQN
jgi:dipeptidyl aminopeptidase/acylaminoacyl peptidase